MPASFLDPRPPIELAEGIYAQDVAEGCRDAMTSFLASIANASSTAKSVLAAWLAGPYRMQSAHAPRVADALRQSDVAPARLPTQLASASIERIVAAARQEVLTALRAASTSGIFARTALAAGHVRRSRDALGRSGYVPVDHERMRLAERVLSLAAVDYLMRPSDYFALLTVCGVCEAVTFDPHTRARGLCRLHAPSLARIALKG